MLKESHLNPGSIISRRKPDGMGEVDLYIVVGVQKLGHNLPVKVDKKRRRTLFEVLCLKLEEGMLHTLVIGTPCSTNAWKCLVKGLSR